MSKYLIQTCFCDEHEGVSQKNNLPLGEVLIQSVDGLTLIAKVQISSFLDCQSSKDSIDSWINEDKVDVANKDLFYTNMYFGKAPKNTYLQLDTTITIPSFTKEELETLIVNNGLSTVIEGGDTKESLLKKINDDGYSLVLKL